MFQSAPAIAGERDSVQQLISSPGRRFNPRPPLLASVTRIVKRTAQAWEVLQSAPAIAGERDRLSGWHTHPMWSFNPRPPLLASVTAGRHRLQAPPNCFNPRPPLLASVTLRRLRHRPHGSRFNPRPPLLASVTVPPLTGRTTSRFQSAPAIAGERDMPSLFALTLIRVSIRARHCWRA